MGHRPVIIIGAGLAGLTAAYELVKRNILPIVLGQADKVGSLSCTEVHKGYRFDIGGHRFYTKIEGVQQLEGRHIKSLAVRHGDNSTEIGGVYLISSMPLAELISRLDPPTGLCRAGSPQPQLPRFDPGGASRLRAR